MDNNVQLFKGDCLEVMDKLIEKDVKVDCILTDPPYGTTTSKWDSIIPFDDMWERINNVIKPNGTIILFGTEPFTSKLITSNIKAYKEKIVWIKHKPSNFACARYMHLKYTEDVVVFGYKRLTFNKQVQPRVSPRIKEMQRGKSMKCYTVRNDGNEVSMGTQYEPKSWNEYDADFKNPMDYIEIPSVVSNSKEKVNHPTQKPVKLLEYLIKTYTNENELVLDFTMGSGSTGVACVNTNRNFIGIEKDDNYFEIAKKRIEEVREDVSR